VNEPASGPARGDWREGLPLGVGYAELPPVRRVQFDSRAVAPGDLFVCIVGERSDGHDYAAQAVRNGAIALVAQAGRGTALAGLGVPVVEAPDTRRALSSIAAAHEGYPARRLTVIGITGTDGKSTAAFLTLAALEGCGLRAGLLTTVETRIAGRTAANANRLTTQEAPVIQRLLADMIDAGCTHAVIEATSHGLELHRLADCDIDVAAFTNLTPDHLDFHRTFEAYREAKARLFAMLDQPTAKQGPRGAVLNADDASWRVMAAATRTPALTYGLERTAEGPSLLATNLELRAAGASFCVERAEGSPIEGAVQLPGRFNVSNALAALGVAVVLGLDVQAAAVGIAACPGVPGRMERIPGAPFEVIVDYAHTADALEQVLRMLRPLAPGRLIVVFGCAGERARARRSGLGDVAARLSDYAVLTEEDPRSESSAAIIAEIAEAMTAAGAREGEHFERVEGRDAAIERAIRLARHGDLVLVAGKGHESTIERADGSHPWDDRAQARAAIGAVFGSALSGEGPRHDTR